MDSLKCHYIIEDDDSSCSPSSNERFYNKDLYSMSLEDMRTQNEFKNVNPSNSLSLNNINNEPEVNQQHEQMRLSNLSLNALSSLIMSNNLPIFTEINAGGHQSKRFKPNETHQDLINKQLDSHCLSMFIKLFRLCSIMLPPSNKRRLHLLLRFLNKLKTNEQTTAAFLMRNCSTSSSPSNKLEIENFIIDSFYSTIVFVDKTGHNIEMNELIGKKLIRILINNYTDIMKVPEDLVSLVKNKLASYTSSNVTRNKIKIDEYDRNTNDSVASITTKQNLTQLLTNILADLTMKEEEKIQRLSLFKQQHPQIYEEKYPTIKKALTILGLTESSGSLLSLKTNQSMNTTSTSTTSNQKVKLTKTTLQRVTDKIDKTSNSMLNHTTIGATAAKHTMSNVLGNSSIVFPKFFGNLTKSSKK
jgi:hypothetical protein